MQKREQNPLTKGHLGRDRKLNAEIRNTERIKKDYERTLRQNDLLLKESGGYIEADEGEDLLRLRQKDLKPLIPIANADKIFDLNLEYGFYSLDYTRNGRYLALAGTKGHIAILDWKKKDLKCEFNVKDKIRDIKFLQNETMIAVAQKKFLYIYDNTGSEIHRLKSHPEPLHLEYLPYHYLLVSIGKEGSLKYQDISTGALVADHRTKIRESSALVQNPYNGIMLVGDSRGQVTMWSPNTGNSLVQMLCHRGSINSVAVDNSGKYLATAGTDGKMKVWDVRTYQVVHEYTTSIPATKITISQKGILALGISGYVELWKDWYGEKQKKPYLKQDTYEGRVLTDLQFAPYEDFLGIGLIDGFSSIVVPGSGEPNFDSFETNVYQTKKQKGEDEVAKLMDKLPADTITIDPTIIGTIDKASKEVKDSEKKVELDEAERRHQANKRKRVKQRGRSSTKEQFKKKESVYDEDTRARIKQILDNKLKMKRLEKKKAVEERKMIENQNLLDVDPVEILKKIKK